MLIIWQELSQNFSLERNVIIRLLSIPSEILAKDLNQDNSSVYNFGTNWSFGAQGILGIDTKKLKGFSLVTDV